MHLKKCVVFLLIVVFSISFVSAATLSNPFENDIDDNPAKLFFHEDSVFVGELMFKDLFADSSNINPVFKKPGLDANVLIMGGLFALKFGASVDMTSRGGLYEYDAIMKRYINVAFSVGYKVFSFGAGITLTDDRIHTSTFNKNIPFLSFLWESYFVGYTDIPGSTDSYLNLSLMVTDKQYFGVSITSPNFLRFNTTNPVFDWTELYQNLNFSTFAKTPDYDKNDDLNVVVSSLTIDTVGILGINKKLSITNIIALVLSPDMRINLLNTVDFNFVRGTRYSLDDTNFLHTLAVEFESKRFVGELGFEIPPSAYRGLSSAFGAFIKLNVKL